MRKILAICVAGVFAVMFAGPASACTTVPVADPPTLTEGTCSAAGAVTALDTDSYTWVITGTREATVYTATKKGDYALAGQVAWTFDLTTTDQLDADDPTCRTEVIPEAPTATVPTCLAAGVVTAPVSDDYGWLISGPANATLYTAIAKSGHTISGLDHWTFDLSKIAWTSPACHPYFESASECGSATITFVNASPWDRFPDFRIGDEDPSGDYGSGPVYSVVKVLAGQTKVIYSGSLAEDSFDGSVAIAYQDILGSERDIDTASTSVVVPTNCLADVLPVITITQAQVTPTAPTCNADGSLTLTDGEHFTWGEPHVLGVGTSDVTATAAEGYVFAGGEDTALFNVEVLPATGDQSTDASAGCYVAPVVVPPVVDPPVVVPVVVDPIITPVVTVASATPTVSNQTLAYTGIDGLPWLLLGAAGLIGFGALTVNRTARERRVRA